MRPLLHPSAEHITLEGILHALSDPVRVRIFSEIARSEGPQNCCAFLEVSEKAVPKSTLSLHFKALREAGLIRSERKGVQMHNTARCDEIDERFPGLLGAILEAHETQAERERHSRRKRRKKAA